MANTDRHHVTDVNFTARSQVPVSAGALPPIKVNGGWHELFAEPAQQALERILPVFLRSRRWFGGKARTILSASIRDVIPLKSEPFDRSMSLVLVNVDYADGNSECYQLPLAFGDERQTCAHPSFGPSSIVARLDLTAGGRHIAGVLFDAWGDEELSRLLLDAVATGREFQAGHGKLAGRPAAALPGWQLGPAANLNVSMLKTEQSNSTVLYGDRALLKLFRRVEEGVNPELEIGRFLTDVAHFDHSPAVLGAVEYVAAEGPRVTIGILEGFVPNVGNAWKFTVEAVGHYYHDILENRPPPELPPEMLPSEPLWKLAQREAPPLAKAHFGAYLDTASLLGRRTAEMHVALCTATELPQFGQQPFDPTLQRATYRAMRELAVRSLAALRRKLSSVPHELEHDGEALLAREEEVFQRLRPIVRNQFDADCIRCHGDYHLGQVLYTGSDFVIIDFEGEPARSIRERQAKTSPFRDIAGMLRSFDYASYQAIHQPLGGRHLHSRDYARLEPWMHFWTTWTSATFLRSYLDVAGGQSFVPREAENAQLLLDVHLLEKALYELRYELNNRPDWVGIPLHGILGLLNSAATN